MCCKPPCSAEYWSKQRPTISEMRRLVRDEQNGKCAHCKKELHEFNANECLHIIHPYILDHIRPIAMQGDQWARENLQVLCIRCNRIKTARDMGAIARWKRYHLRGLARPEDNSWLMHEPGKPAGPGGVRSDVLPLPFVVQCVEPEHRFPGGRDASDHHKLVAKDRDADILKIVMAGTPDDDILQDLVS